MQKATQTDKVSMMQEVSSDVQTQGHKGTVQDKAATLFAIQIQAVIQI